MLGIVSHNIERCREDTVRAESCCTMPIYAMEYTYLMSYKYLNHIPSFIIRANNLEIPNIVPKYLLVSQPVIFLVGKAEAHELGFLTFRKSLPLVFTIGVWVTGADILSLGLGTCGNTDSALPWSWEAIVVVAEGERGVGQLWGIHTTFFQISLSGNIPLVTRQLNRDRWWWYGYILDWYSLASYYHVTINFICFSISSFLL